MSPFGHKREDEQGQDKQEQLKQWRAAVEAEFERLNALSLAELATEVMVKGFGPGGDNRDDYDITVGQANRGAGPTVAEISSYVQPERGFEWVPNSQEFELVEPTLDRITKLVAEGLQELEHASLVRCQLHTEMGYLDWAVTRRGRAALERGEVAGVLQAASAQR
jgi:hypothetical protein